jgi:hypothetical protein
LSKDKVEEETIQNEYSLAKAKDWGYKSLPWVALAAHV